MTLIEELTSILNRASRENESNTPDFILAEYMLGALQNAEALIQKRDKWYGLQPRPGNHYRLDQTPSPLRHLEDLATVDDQIDPDERLNQDT